MIRAVIFDLDRVIVNSEDAHIKAERLAFLEYGVKVSAHELHRYA